MGNGARLLATEGKRASSEHIRKATALGAFYRRIQLRAGTPKAVTARARRIAERVYRL